MRKNRSLFYARNSHFYWQLANLLCNKSIVPTVYFVFISRLHHTSPFRSSWQRLCGPPLCIFLSTNLRYRLGWERVTSELYGWAEDLHLGFPSPVISIVVGTRVVCIMTQLQLSKGIKRWKRCKNNYRILKLKTARRSCSAAITGALLWLHNFHLSC